MALGQASAKGLKTGKSIPCTSRDAGRERGARWYHDGLEQFARHDDFPGVNRFRRGLQESSGHAEAQVLVNPTAIANLTANDETYALAA